MLLLAVMSITGTLIPQNRGPAFYQEAYGEFTYKLLSIFDFFDMYHSFWFQTLLLILTINIIVCSLDRLPAVLKIIFIKKPLFSIAKYKKTNGKREFSLPISILDTKGLFVGYIAKKFHTTKVESNDGGFVIFAEKGRWTKLGVYIVHSSVLFLVLGAMIGSIFGVDGYINIPEGNQVQAIQLNNSENDKSLPFAIRCDDFNVSFYDSGTPKEFRSTLSIIQNEESVLTKDIIVNRPLRYNGINIFQSSYGTLSPNKVELDFTIKKSRMSYTKNITVGNEIELPENMGRFKIERIFSSYSFRGNEVGESLVGKLIPPGKDPVNIILPFRFPNFDKMRKGNVAISVKDYTKRYYTGLQVTKDPGVSVVYLGFVLMIIGCYITFFMAHQSICVEIENRGKTTQVTVSGKADRNGSGMQNYITQLSKKLSKLSPEPGVPRTLKHKHMTA